MLQKTCCDVSSMLTMFLFFQGEGHGGQGGEERERERERERMREIVCVCEREREAYRNGPFILKGPIIMVKLCFGSGMIQVS